MNSNTRILAGFRRGGVFLALGAAGLLASGAVWAGSFTFTTDADWNTGVITNLTGDPPPATGDGHLRLPSAILTPFNHIWVALSGRGTVARLDTNAAPGTYTAAQAGGAIVLGEYYTAPNGRGRNPSRTTVDANGDVWVGNRDEAAGGLGSVAKVSASPTGTTSSGVWNDGSNGGASGTFNALPWTNAGGADNNGGVTTATDSAQMLYVRTTGTAVRTVAVDANNDVWVGGYGNRQHQLYDGDTGAAIPGPGNSFNTGQGGYGGVVDGNGVLWSSSLTNFVAKHDPATNTTTNVNLGRTSYGMGIDNNGKLWVSNWTANTVQRINPITNAIEGTFATGRSSLRGVAVTPDNDIWIAASGSGGVVRLGNDGSVKGFIATGNTPTGVAVDANGKVWVTNFGSSTVSRIDPASGTFGAVDLTVDLGSGATPYNYSDMTGTVLIGQTTPSGTWRRVMDGGVGVTWDNIFWNEEPEGAIPDLTGLLIEARVSDDLLDWSMYVAYDSGDLLNLMGRYLEVRATLSRPGGTDLTPVLSDLRVTFSSPPNGVSEPATLGLLGVGLIGLGWLRRRQQG